MRRGNDGKLLHTLALLWRRASGRRSCNLETRSLICSSVILDEPDCLDRDLRLDISVNVATWKIGGSTFAIERSIRMIGVRQASLRC
jgi:hypothetical protein